MVRCTAEERALARASIYRLLALAFSYPTKDAREALAEALPVAAVAAELLDEPTAQRVEGVRVALEATTDAELEGAYQRVLTLSYSEDCPVYETAFSASHIFQQASQQADLAGFYSAFGVTPHGERPDHLAMETEFAYLLALKEARARELGESDHVRVCRDAARAFMRQHLARWAPLIGQRLAVRGAGTLYGVAGELLVVFTRYEERFLRLGEVKRYRDEPAPVADEPGDFTCPMGEESVAQPVDLPLIETSEEERHVAAISS